MKNLLFILSVGFLLMSCTKKKGCTDISAVNYSATAEVDDGSCTQPTPPPSTTTSPTPTTTTSNSTTGGSSCSNYDLSYVTDGAKFVYKEKNPEPGIEYYVSFNPDGTFILMNGLTKLYDNVPFEGTWSYGNGCQIIGEIHNYPIAAANIVYYTYEVEVLESIKFAEFSWLTWESNYSYETSFRGTKK